MAVDTNSPISTPVGAIVVVVMVVVVVGATVVVGAIVVVVTTVVVGNSVVVVDAVVVVIVVGGTVVVVDPIVVTVVVVVACTARTGVPVANVPAVITATSPSHNVNMNPLLSTLPFRLISRLPSCRVRGGVVRNTTVPMVTSVTDQARDVRRPPL